jgi:hypothetical protein
MHLNANLAEAEHVPGVLNTVFDGLSRNVSPQELGLDPLLMYNATADDAIIWIVQLCNPVDQLSDMASIQHYYNNVLVCSCFDTLVNHSGLELQSVICRR